MASITITIPDQVVGRVLDAFDGSYSGRVVVDEGGNQVETMTKAAWAKAQILNYAKDVVKGYERRQAAAAADVAAADAVDNEITLS